MKYSVAIGIGSMYTLKRNLVSGTGYTHEREKHMENTTPKITKKEADVLLWVQRALSNKEIARQIKLSESTVKMHVGSLIKKYGVRNRTQLSTFSLQGQSIDLSKYVPKDLEATPCCWTLKEKGKVVAFSLQKDRPSPDWDASYSKKKA